MPQEAHPHTMQLETNPGAATKPAARLDRTPVPSPIGIKMPRAHAEMPTWSNPGPLSRLSHPPSAHAHGWHAAHTLCTWQGSLSQCPSLLAHLKTACLAPSIARSSFITPWLHGDCSPCSASPRSRSPASLPVSSLFGILHSTVILAPRGMSRIAFDSQIYVYVHPPNSPPTTSGATRYTLHLLS
ncbi:uncharacterized protein CC84DRAFT_723945 [Paraphaeosphaeria sporulosa]|uniref:Uncharacterized protein n=1 Tax=Paraphaeosphaeria sporulosa TaxID=1460663 RepID=A0A177CFK7_9PLEO|nr:uncharacterized protein CC84DRAFT_723945 [Paraphaeosphaeria sporulosa]OAG05507.1 hypothetical protein CC84DRAFT_723945 [Paraphaeosphaeria sporulosa]